MTYSMEYANINNTSILKDRACAEQKKAQNPNASCLLARLIYTRRTL